MYRYSPFFELSPVIRSQWVLPSQFWLLCYEFLLQILNSGIAWHWTLRELSRLGEPKRLYEEKLPRLPGLPYPARCLKLWMISLRSTWKAYLSPSARTMDLGIVITNWLCLSLVPIFWNVVSATVGHICGIAFHLTSEPLDLLLILEIR